MSELKMSNLREAFAKIDELNIKRAFCKIQEGEKRPSLDEYIRDLKKRNSASWTAELDRAYPLWIEASTKRIFGSR
jgi:hypothetical protein